MLKTKRIYDLGLIFAGLFFMMVSCGERKIIKMFKASDSRFIVNGRTDVLEDGSIALVGSASSFETLVLGDSAMVHLHSSTDYDYATLVVDGHHLGRFKIDSVTTFSLPIAFHDTTKLEHHLAIFKATEANSGNLVIRGILADSIMAKPDSQENLKIEFIGNSITCGAAMDDALMPCENDDYKNYHNAYLSYGPTVARALHADYLISAVSGFGIYRGWNTEAGETVNTVPEVYGNVYLDGHGQKPHDFSAFTPDIVSIGLGTNDLSEGDGLKERKPFDASKFVKRYIGFIESIYSRYPDTQIVLMNSPMVSGDKNSILVDCLDKVKTHFDTTEITKSVSSQKPIVLFSFSRTYQNGCSTHPNIEDHAKMAEELLPVYKRLSHALDY
ncbi:MAG: GDSL-type esterase/lipase family protein [Pricia sp.]